MSLCITYNTRTSLRYWFSANVRLLQSFFPHVLHTTLVCSTKLTFVVIFYTYVVLFSIVRTALPSQCFRNGVSILLTTSLRPCQLLPFSPSLSSSPTCFQHMSVDLVIFSILVLLRLVHTVEYVWFRFVQAHVLVSTSLKTYAPTPDSYLCPFFTFTTARLSYMWFIHYGADHPQRFHFHCHSRRPSTKNGVLINLPWVDISFTSSDLSMRIFPPFCVTLARCWRRPSHHVPVILCSVLVQVFFINKVNIYYLSFDVVHNFLNGNLVYFLNIHVHV